jgi:6-phosphogluconolactonase
VTVELRVVDDPAHAAAELLVATAGTVALSGGSSVGRVYELAAAARPDWSGAVLWFGDERAVPPYDERSNHRLVRSTLLDALSRPPEVHRIKGELGAEDAAARYDEELEGVTFDLALNGIGADGHTASLFPDSSALASERRAVAAEPGLEPFVPRVTLTPRVFAETQLLVYLVTGDSKAEAVRRALAEEPGPGTPASLVRGRTTIALLDPAAASLL